MNGLSRSEADEFASWFRCLADGTRVAILHTVASAPGPMTVGQIVEIVGKSQSTVSRHLQVLAADEFISMEPAGVSTLVRINEECMTALPAAAARIMGTSMSAP